MRLLCVFGLVFIHARAAGQVFFAKLGADCVTCGHHRLGRHVDAIGAHVGNQPGLVQALRRRHRHFRTHAVFARRLLLQGRGHEGRGGVAGGWFRLDRLHGQVARLHGLHRQFGGGGVGQVKLVQLFACQRGQPCVIFGTARGFQAGGDGPVFLGAKRLDLHLAVNDQPQADRLHAACGFCAGQFAPQDGGQVEPDEVIQCPARKVGIDQRHIDLAGVFHRLGHRGFGDGVKGDAADGGVFLDRLAVAQCLGKVPGNRLALAVGVGGQDQGIVIFERVGDGLEVLAAIGLHLPIHGKVVVGMHRAILWRQVAHMAVRRQNGIAGPQIGVDRLGLGGRFNNDNGHGESLGNGQRARPHNMGGQIGRCQCDPVENAKGRHKMLIYI